MLHSKLKILVFVCPWNLQASYKRDFLKALQTDSNHDVFFCSDFPDETLLANNLVKADYDLNNFDAVIIDRSIWISSGYPSSKLDRALDSYRGVKVVMVNNDYYNTENIRIWIENRSIDLVITAVNGECINKVYSRQRFTETEFVNILPGYVPIDSAIKNFKVVPLKERHYDVVYRGRHFRREMGELAKDKWDIGKKMKVVCDNNNLREDIEWEESNRILNFDWYHFLQNGRTTLGTESGANIFDEHGAIKKYFDAHGPTSEDEIENVSIPTELNYREMNLGANMNHMPPQLFEAIYLKTALVLFEGEYSNVLKPGRHYIVLKKDFSNIKEVVSKIKDIDLLEELTERTYDEIVNNSDYWYSSVIKTLARKIEIIHQRKIKYITNNAIYLRDSTPCVTSLEDTLVTGMLSRQLISDNLYGQLQDYQKAYQDSQKAYQDSQKAYQDSQKAYKDSYKLSHILEKLSRRMKQKISKIKNR